MKKMICAACIVSFCLIPFFNVAAQPGPRVAVAVELQDHPRIATAIRDLEDAIAYMEAAPHDFGGHKAAAIAASYKAINQLRKAMAYRARRDERQ